MLVQENTGVFLQAIDSLVASGIKLFDRGFYESE